MDFRKKKLNIEISEADLAACKWAFAFYLANKQGINENDQLKYKQLCDQFTDLEKQYQTRRVVYAKRKQAKEVINNEPTTNTTTQ